MINMIKWLWPSTVLLQVRDLWRHKELGVYSEGFTYEGLPSHATALLVVTACSGPGGHA